MSIQKRTVSEPREVEMVVCDGPDCSHSVSAARWAHGTVEDWLSVGRPYRTGDVFHFCSYGCLALWAEQRAMPHPVDVQP